MEPNINEDGILCMLDRLSQETTASDCESSDIDDLMIQANENANDFDRPTEILGIPSHNSDLKNEKANDLKIPTEILEVPSPVIERCGVTEEELQEFIRFNNLEKYEDQENEVHLDFMDSIEETNSEIMLDNVDNENVGTEVEPSKNNLEEGENKRKDVLQDVGNVERISEELIENENEEEYVDMLSEDNLKVTQSVPLNNQESVLDGNKNIPSELPVINSMNEDEAEPNNIDVLPIQKRPRKKKPNPEN